MANYECVAGGTLADSFPWSFRMYMTSADSESAAQSAWSSSINAMFTYSAFEALLPSETNCSYTYTSTMSADWKQTTKTQTDEDLVGTGTQSMPYHVCETVTWRTAQATKYGHGRWYLPALCTTALATDGYYLSSTAVGDIVAAVNAAITAWSGVLTPVILHRNGTRSGPGPLTTDNVISGDVPDGLTTQRRRADKRVPTRTSLTF